MSTKYFTVILLFAFLVMKVNGQSKSEYIQIISKFQLWKEAQYKNGTFETENRCNVDTVLKDDYKGSNMGIPKDIKISFTDINSDNILDAIVMFSPDQCDGGNALMNAQIPVLILSNGKSYYTDDNFFNKIEGQYKNGWLIIENATYGTFYGVYYEYKDGDGRCCPSIRRPIQIDYKTKKLTFSDKN